MVLDKEHAEKELKAVNATKTKDATAKRGKQSLQDRSDRKDKNQKETAKSNPFLKPKQFANCAAESSYMVAVCLSRRGYPILVCVFSRALLKS